MEQITSIKHEKIIFARGLQQQKERLKSRCFLVLGFEALHWVKSSPCQIEYCLVHDKLEPQELKLPKVPLYSCSEGILKKVTGTNYLVPVVAVVSLPNRAVAGDLKVVFDGVQDFGNIGTIVRTAAAFGIHDLVSTVPDFDLFHRKTVDASRGTVFSAHCKNFEGPKEAIDSLKKAGYQVVVTALEGSQLQSLVKLEKKPVAIVFGNETSGVSQEVLESADLCIQIPMATELDSLNVGVAAGISLYELKLKMVLMMLNEKIRGSLGRNLASTAKWLKGAFDQSLQAVCDLSADQAILLMILSCDDKGEKETLLKMGGVVESNPFESLTEAGYITESGNSVAITERGKELLGKVWNVHENVENRALAGLSVQEREQLMGWLAQIQKNLEKQLPYEEL